MEIPTALDITGKGTINKQWYKHFLCYAGLFLRNGNSYIAAVVSFCYIMKVPPPMTRNMINF